MLEINVKANEITEGSKTIINPSIIFVMKSPAIMKVIYKDQEYLEKDGLIFIENAEYGNYEVKVTGKDNGLYTILIGMTNSTNTNWIELDGKIDNIIPSLQVDDYTIKFDSKNDDNLPIIDETNNDYFNLFINSINKIENANNKKLINNIIKKIKYAQKELKWKKYLKLKILLLNIHKLVFNLYKNNKNINLRNNIRKSIDILEKIYIKTLSGKRVSLNKNLLLKEYRKLLSNMKFSQSLLDKMYKRGIDVTYETEIVTAIDKKMDKVKKCIYENRLIEAEIYLKSIKEYIQCINKIKLH